jgi:hypothetical protein
VAPAFKKNHNNLRHRDVSDRTDMMEWDGMGSEGRGKFYREQRKITEH